MTVLIDENILLGFMGVIFLPLLGFLIKLIVDIGIIKNRVEGACRTMEEHSDALSAMNKHENRLNLLEARLDRIERDNGYSFGGGGGRHSGSGSSSSINSKHNLPRGDDE